MNLLRTIFDTLFGCTHSQLTRVFTVRHRSYRVCCNCGKEFEYSLQSMSIVDCADRVAARAVLRRA